MSDITPVDALRELGDDQAEYAAAAAKKQAQAAERDLASIRERWEWRVSGCPEPAPVPANRAKDDDIGWLLAEVQHLTDARIKEVTDRVHRARDVAAKWDREAREACRPGHGGGCPDCIGHAYAQELRNALDGPDYIDASESP